MTTTARRVRAIPVRTSTQAWEKIVELLASADVTIRPHLEEAANVASMLITEEHTAIDPIILTGCGPQVRVYTLHGTKAIDGANENEQPLTLTATDAWRVSLPATGDDLELARASITDNVHVEVYDRASTPSTATVAEPSSATSRAITVDLSALEN